MLLYVHRSRRFIRDGSPGRPPRRSHSSRVLSRGKLLLKYCFKSTETVGLLGTGAQDVHLDFLTVPELWVYKSVVDRFYIGLLSSLEQTHCVFGTIYRTVLSCLVVECCWSFLCIALFSSLEQTRCALVGCDSKWETVAFHRAFLNVHVRDVLTALVGCYMVGAKWNCCRLGACSVDTIQPTTHHVALVHAKQHT